MTGPRSRNHSSNRTQQWKRIAGVVALAAMVAFAGCNGILGGDQQNNTTSNATMTPLDVPTDQPTASPASQLAPGLTSTGVTNRALLLNAQRAFLENHSTVTRTNTTVTAANGTILFSIHQTIRADSSDEVVALSANYSGRFLGIGTSPNLMDGRAMGERTFGESMRTGLPSTLKVRAAV